MADQALVVADSVDKNAFLGYLEHSLLPTLAAGSVLVMDNWSVHHGDEVRNLVEDSGCELLYLPTYSPDLNPIEHLFAKIKAFIKNLRPNTVANLTQAFCDATKTLTPENAHKSFKHCGYPVRQ